MRQHVHAGRCLRLLFAATLAACVSTQSDFGFTRNSLCRQNYPNGGCSDWRGSGTSDTAGKGEDDVCNGDANYIDDASLELCPAATSATIKCCKLSACEGSDNAQYPQAKCCNRDEYPYCEPTDGGAGWDAGACAGDTDPGRGSTYDQVLISCCLSGKCSKTPATTVTRYCAKTPLCCVHAPISFALALLSNFLLHRAPWLRSRSEPPAHAQVLTPWFGVHSIPRTAKASSTTTAPAASISGEPSESWLGPYSCVCVVHARACACAVTADWCTAVRSHVAGIRANACLTSYIKQCRWYLRISWIGNMCVPWRRHPKALLQERRQTGS